MGAYKLTNKSLKVNNLKYYRSNGIKLGDVGTKKRSVFSVNRVDSQSNIPAPKLKVKAAPPLKMDSTFAGNIAASFSYNGMNAGVFREQLTKGKLKLVRYYMDNRDMENGIERSPQLIETIRSIGRSARVVSDVYTVVSAEMYEKTKGGAKFECIPTDRGETRLERGTKVVIGAGTVLAYMLNKIDWRERQKRNWSRIDKLIEDPKGL